MKRCLQIAQQALGSARPNPMVGAIVVHQNKIIGEGFTSAYGGPHAEVNAIASVRNKALLKDSTLYVSLEPCNHFGKTPPCTQLIKDSKIPRVVIGCLDDHPLVAGKGVETLKSAGVTVTVGVLKNQCQRHHKRFFTFHNKKRPYVILKWAETTDGFIAPNKKLLQRPVWISNTYSRQLTHKWRAEEQAILVGKQTVLADNPSLTVRDWTGNHPTRVIVGRHFDDFNEASYAVFNTAAETIKITIQKNRPFAQQVLKQLHERNISSVIVEGGSFVLHKFIEENLWDEARVFKSAVALRTGLPAPTIQFQPSKSISIANDQLYYYYHD